MSLLNESFKYLQDIEMVYLECLEELKLAGATADVKNKSAVDFSRDFYRAKMRELFGSSKRLLKLKELSDEHSRKKRDAHDQLKNRLIPGEDAYMKPYFSKLDQVGKIHILKNVEKK